MDTVIDLDLPTDVVALDPVPDRLMEVEEEDLDIIPVVPCPDLLAVVTRVLL